MSPFFQFVAPASLRTNKRGGKEAALKTDAKFKTPRVLSILQINKGELLEKISDIRKEYADVVKEAQAIQQTQKVRISLITEHVCEKVKEQQ